MGYLKIPNLYKSPDILNFRKVWALEKIDGTSAHVGYRAGEQLHFFGGCVKHQDFKDLFNEQELFSKFQELGKEKVTIYGEAYGGKIQGMSKTYGPNLRFIAFDVKINDWWLSVPDAANVVGRFGLQFVPYQMIDTEISALEALRDKDSDQAIINGMGDGKKREGIILRPPTELQKQDGTRIIAKFKAAEWREVNKEPELGKLEVEMEASKIALQWVTANRLEHVIAKVYGPLTDFSIEKTGKIVKAMLEDIRLEGAGEIYWSKEAEKRVGKETAMMYKKWLEKHEIHRA